MCTGGCVTLENLCPDYIVFKYIDNKPPGIRLPED